jgi:hypothetical protein
MGNLSPGGVGSAVDSAEITDGTIVHADLAASVTASAGDTTTGTAANKFVTPDGLAGSAFGKRFVNFPMIGALTTGDGKAFWSVPAEFNGWIVVGVYAGVGTVSSSGTPTFQFRNATDAVDILSTLLTIDANEATRATSAAAAVINGSNDDLATGDKIFLDCDVAGTGTADASVQLIIQAP